MSVAAGSGVVNAFKLMSSIPLSNGSESNRQRFESVLCQGAFDGLKAIFERLGVDRAALVAAVFGTDSYENLLAQLGHKLVLTRQIHVQHCYTQLGPEGGIKAVLPYYDIPTQSSLPTLVNFDTTLTTTPKAVVFFDALLVELKKQCHAQI
jgi:hypothetical protein